MKTIFTSFLLLLALSFTVPALAQYGGSTYGNVADVGQSEPETSGQTFVFQNPGFSYTVSGQTGTNPAITMERGKTYTLNFQEVTNGHPIALRLSSGNTSAVQGTSGNNPSSGVAGAGATVTYTVPMNAPDSIVYQCVFHPGMIGTINIVSASVANVAPVVAITGGSRTVADTNGAAGESVALTATATDSDGTIASTEWLVAGQVVATGTSATLALPDGATTVTFRATDNSGATTSTTATITVGNVEVQPDVYLGIYNGIALDSRYNLEVNRVGLIDLDRLRLHSCVEMFEDSKPAQVFGMNKIDVTFDILSLDTGAIQLIASRAFSDQSSTDTEPAECSGRFETTTNIYRDYIKLGAELFDVSFKLINGDTLEFSLVDATLILPQRAKAYIVSPKQGDTVSTSFTVVFGLDNMDVAPAGDDKPNSGHFHLLINKAELPDLSQALGADVMHFGGGQTQTTLTLEPGQHTLQLVMGDHLHVPHNPPVISEKITITVE